MNYVWFGIAGILGGVLGGMGMGGGTVLIPLLGIFYNVSQHTAQAVNLISFVPMAVGALIVHLKNKMIEFDKLLWIIIPGLLFCTAGSFIAKAITGNVLTRAFGGFLIILSIFQFVSEIKKKQ